MITFPIRIPRDRYRGMDQKKRAKSSKKNRIAALIENYLNDKIATQKSGVVIYTFPEIASDLGIDKEIVYDLCGGINGDHNAISIDREVFRIPGYRHPLENN